MGFEQEHEAFIQSHLGRRTGERKGRLERGHQHGEALFLKQVWWPLQGNFDHLHPEYEIQDWRGRSHFGDFAYLPGSVKLIFEIKGYGPHVREMDRQRYCDELNRELFLQALGYRVVSFAYDDVAARPELCITLLRMLLSRYQARKMPSESTSGGVIERELLRYALGLARPIRPLDVEAYLQVSHRTAIRLLQELSEKGWMRPVPTHTGARVTKYEVASGVYELLD